MIGEFRLRYYEREFVERFLADGADAGLTSEQRKALTFIKGQREHLAKLGWDPPFRWSWWRHPVLAFRQWRARHAKPPRSADVEALRAQMARVAAEDKRIEREATHGLVRFPQELRAARQERMRKEHPRNWQPRQLGAAS